MKTHPNHCNSKFTAMVFWKMYFVLLAMVSTFKGSFGQLRVDMSVTEFGFVGGEAEFVCNYSSDNLVIDVEWYHTTDPSVMGENVLSIDPVTANAMGAWKDRVKNFNANKTSFILSPLKKSDQGLYRCVVISDDTVTKEAYLQVFDPPNQGESLRILEEYGPIGIGQTAIFTCQAKAPANLMWYINNAPVTRADLPLNLTLTDPMTQGTLSILKVRVKGNPDLNGARLVCRADMPGQGSKEITKNIQISTSTQRSFGFNFTPYPLLIPLPGLQRPEPSMPTTNISQLHTGGDIQGGIVMPQSPLDTNRVPKINEDFFGSIENPIQTNVSLMGASGQPMMPAVIGAMTPWHNQSIPEPSSEPGIAQSSTTPPMIPKVFVPVAALPQPQSEGEPMAGQSTLIPSHSVGNIMANTSMPPSSPIAIAENSLAPSQPHMNAQQTMLHASQVPPVSPGEMMGITTHSPGISDLMVDGQGGVETTSQFPSLIALSDGASDVTIPPQSASSSDMMTTMQSGPDIGSVIIPAAAAAVGGAIAGSALAGNRQTVEGSSSSSMAPMPQPEGGGMISGLPPHTVESHVGEKGEIMGITPLVPPAPMGIDGQTMSPIEANTITNPQMLSDAVTTLFPTSPDASRNRTLDNINMLMTGSPREVSATAPLRNDMAPTTAKPSSAYVTIGSPAIVFITLAAISFI